MPSNTRSADYGKFDELAEEFAARFRRGERPSLQEYIDRCPELADDIRELFPALVEVERVDKDQQEPSDAAGTSVAVPPLRQVGDYRIVREVGRGGMGVVYEAEQISLGRHVALKVLPLQLRPDARIKSRFEREAKAAAKLHHTNIVPVFSVGEHDGLRYYAMQFIQGLGLDVVLEELKRSHRWHGGALSNHSFTGGEPRAGPATVSAANLAESLVTGRFALVAQPVRNEHAAAPTVVENSCVTSDNDVPRPTPIDVPVPDVVSSSSATLPGVEAARQSGKKLPTYWQSVARIGVQVGEALEYAHKQGVLHRDIKPSNLLLDHDGTVWVTDFGLAKVDDQPNLTHTGDILGTLRYMPPEAFDGRADQRGDVYSLGLTLYELLALRPAFEEKERQRLIKRLTSEEPPRLDKLNREIPRDLVTVVQKAIDREAARRYPTAAALAGDLQRFLAYEPIRARRATTTEQLSRWCRRNPRVASLAAALALVFLIGFAGIAWKWREAEKQTDIARAAGRQEKAQHAIAVAQAERATAEADRFRRLLYDTEMSLAQQAWDAGDTGRALALLEKQQPRDGQEDLRGFEWRYLRALCRDGSRLTLRGHTADITSVLFSPDGKTFITTAADQSVRIWDLTSQRCLRLAGPWINAVALSPDGRVLAFGPSNGKCLRFWDIAGRRELASLPTPDNVGAAALSPDGKLIATCYFDPTIRLWDLATRREVGSGLVGHHGSPLRAIFSPDGKSLASAGRDTTVRIWDVATQREIKCLRGHTDWVRSIAISPDGKMLASVSDDTSVRLWDTASGQTLKVLRSHGTALTSVAFSPEGMLLATGGGEGTIRLWDTVTKELKSVLRGHTTPIMAVAFAPDGRSLVSGSRDGAVKVWDVETGPDPNVLSGHRAQFASLAVSPDGKTLAASVGDEANSVVELWDVASRRPIGPLRGHLRPAWGVRFAPDGKSVATAGSDMTIRVWDVASRKQSMEFRLPDRAFGVTYSPDGRLLAASVSATQTLLVWDLASRREVAHLAPALRARFSPDGTLLAAGSGYAIRIWDVATWRIVAVLEGQQREILGLAFSPDGRTLASRDSAGYVWLWNLARKEAVGRRGHSASTPPSFAGVEFSPDGGRLATSGGDCTVKLWDVGLMQEVATLTGHEAPINGLAFMPDGDMLATASSDATVRLWQAPPLAQVTREPAEAPSRPPPETVPLLRLQLDGTAQATLTAEPDAHRIDVTAVDGTDWHVQFNQWFDDLHEGATYSLGFRAKAEPRGSMVLAAHIAEPDWQSIGLSKEVSLSDGWQAYQYEFQAKQIAARNLVVFNLGGRTGSVWIADFTLTRIAK